MCKRFQMPVHTQTKVREDRGVGSEGSFQETITETLDGAVTLIAGRAFDLVKRRVRITQNGKVERP